MFLDSWEPRVPFLYFCHISNTVFSSFRLAWFCFFVMCVYTKVAPHRFGLEVDLSKVASWRLCTMWTLSAFGRTVCDRAFSGLDPGPYWIPLVLIYTPYLFALSNCATFCSLSICFTCVISYSLAGYSLACLQSKLHPMDLLTACFNLYPSRKF